jgi:hypothetical protein
MRTYIHALLGSLLALSLTQCSYFFNQATHSNAGEDVTPIPPNDVIPFVNFNDDIHAVTKPQRLTQIYMNINNLPPPCLLSNMKVSDRFSPQLHHHYQIKDPILGVIDSTGERFPITIYLVPTQYETEVHNYWMVYLTLNGLPYNPIVTNGTQTAYYMGTYASHYHVQSGKENPGTRFKDLGEQFPWQQLRQSNQFQPYPMWNPAAYHFNEVKSTLSTKIGTAFLMHDIFRIIRQTKQLPWLTNLFKNNMYAPTNQHDDSLLIQNYSDFGVTFQPIAPIGVANLNWTQASTNNQEVGQYDNPSYDYTNLLPEWVIKDPNSMTDAHIDILKTKTAQLLMEARNNKPYTDIGFLGLPLTKLKNNAFERFHLVRFYGHQPLNLKTNLKFQAEPAHTLLIRPHKLQIAHVPYDNRIAIKRDGTLNEAKTDQTVFTNTKQLSFQLKLGTGSPPVAKSFQDCKYDHALSK